MRAQVQLPPSPPVVIQNEKQKDSEGAEREREREIEKRGVLKERKNITDEWTK